MSDIWDVVVVGAGPSGCITAEQLHRQRYKVLLIDAGPDLESGERLREVDRREWPFQVVGESFDWYRVHAIGGRTQLWGGWCYRFPDIVFQRGGWPFDRQALDPSYETAKSYLNLQRGTLSERFSALGRELKLPIFPKVAARTGKNQNWTPQALSVAKQARTYLPALHLEHESGQATSLACLDMRLEKQIKLRARSYVLAASPIETARLLLCSKLGSESSRIGKGLVDHMVASYVLLEPEPPKPCDDSLETSALVENFVNLDEETKRTYPGGFTIELTGPISLQTLDLERMVPKVEEDSWRATQIHAMGECFPHEKRFVSLDYSESDVTGRPVPCIHMEWSKAEKSMAEDMKQACEQLADTLAVPGSKLLQFADPLTAGAGHEAGTCAMGKSPSAPCTPHGRLRALQNVWVADASTMPTSGDRHPTLTILAQAVRAADDCARWLARQ